jgi:hypothetical protein
LIIPYQKFDKTKFPKAESLAASALGIALCYDLHAFHRPERATAKT